MSSTDPKTRFRALLIVVFLVVSAASIVGRSQILNWQLNLGYLALMRGDLVSARTWLGSQCLSSTARIMACFRLTVLSGDFAAANTLVNVPLQTAPDMLTLWLARQARAFLEAGERQSAIQTADLLLNHHAPETRPDVINEAGLVYANVGERQKALEAFSVSAALEPENRFSEGWYQTVALYYDSGEWQEVVDMVAPVVDAPEGPTSNAWQNALHTLALTYGYLDQPTEADRVYRRLAESYPQSHHWPVFQAFVYLGQQDIADGELESAAQRFAIAYDLALEVIPSARADYEAAAWEQIAQLAEAVSASPDSNVVLTSIQSLCQRDPSSAGCYFVLGRLYAQISQSEQADQAYAQACRLACGDASIDSYQNSVYMVAQPECTQR